MKQGLFGFVCLLAVAPVFAATEAETFREFLLDHRDRFQKVEMAKDPLPFAKIHRLPADPSPLVQDGRSYTGFRFTTPDWLESDMIWMFAVPGPEERLEGLKWFVISEQNPEIQPRLYRAAYSNQRFPKFRELFPDCGSFTQQTFPRSFLKPAEDYLVWFSFPGDRTHEIRFALSPYSERGAREFGMLPIGYPETGPSSAFADPPDAEPLPPRPIVDDAVARYREAGHEAGLELLSERLPEYIASGNDFQTLLVAVWREAQNRSGREDTNWAAELFLWLQRTSLSFDASFQAVQTSANAANYLMDQHRYGALGVALKPFHDYMERLGISTDPTTFPDLGPALPELPGVRNRRYPVEPERHASAINTKGWVILRKELPTGFAGSIGHLATMDLHAGRWRRAIERRLWVSHWAETMRETAFEPEARWYSSRSGLAGIYEKLGLLELADAECRTILEKGWPDVYGQRNLMEARHRRIALKIAGGEADEAMLGELDELRAKIRERPGSVDAAWRAVDLTKARCLAALGRRAEADALLGDLMKAGHFESRIEFVRQRLDAGETASLELRLTGLLESCREWGRKIDEAELYSLYARFLELAGRPAEAIAIRREAIRIHGRYDLFVYLPAEIARLARTFRSVGDAEAARPAEERARALLDSDQRIPERIRAEVRAILDQRMAVRDTDGSAPRTDLQPVRALLIPVAGRSARGVITLANIGQLPAAGRLSFTGIPVNAKWDPASASAEVELGQSGSAELDLTIPAGTYGRFDLHAAPPSPEGELEVVWRPESGPAQVSLWVVEPEEDGVSGAILDAGEFRDNPFYGIPIHHHYAAGPQPETSRVPLRVVASRPARIEAYDGEDQPLFIDADGDGDLMEAGDSAFADQDLDGFAELSLADGEASLRLQVFPAGELPEEGMTFRIQTRVADEWTTIAEDRLMP